MQPDQPPIFCPLMHQLNICPYKFKPLALNLTAACKALKRSCFELNFTMRLADRILILDSILGNRVARGGLMFNQ